MAKIKYAPHVEEIRGAVGNIVHSINATGVHVRRRVDPRQPNTAAQRDIRSSFGAFSTAWRNLTQAQRDGWNTLAQTIRKNGLFNADYYTTGQRLFVSLNQTRQVVGLPQLSAPPAAAPVIPAITGATLTATDPGTGNANIVLTLDFVPTPFTAPILVFATAPFSAGRDYIGKSQYRLIGDLPDNTATGQSLRQSYLTKYGILPTLGRKVSIKAVPYDESGFQGIPVIATDTVAAV